MNEGILFQAIDKLWAGSSATGFQRLTSLDWSYIDTWLEAEIPAWAIFMGVERTLGRFRPKSSRDRIHSIAYCEQEIYQVCETHADWMVAESWERRRNDTRA